MEREYAVAFYNLENLFDTKDDPHTLDDDFTPRGAKNWQEERYGAKMNKLAKAISRIGEGEGVHPPAIIGVAEVENHGVMQRLLKSKYLKDIPYDHVHFDSPDERGIDTGLIYHREHFVVKNARTLPLLVQNERGDRDFTRDILYVHGLLNGEEIHCYVNHWPSRRGGAGETEYKRVAAANTILRHMSGISKYPESLHVLVMGDFNDDPHSKSIQTLMESGWFINPFKQLLSPFSGSANYKGEWSMFDQILLSHNFLNLEAGTHNFTKAGIFSPTFLKEWNGPNKGNPFRTFVGKEYLGGYSDHFPVYILLKLRIIYR